jgi:hypothetical protein
MEAKAMVESGKTITIEISTEAYAKLHSVQEELQKILRKKKVSFDQVVKVMFAVTRLDDTLIQMTLE